ncbi:uncharacterized protein BCR38DRAFT_229835 [Pseudomassariella vexata]|uniref:Uncharacterized protein n=1 Tax=Pseudomassariella vexata TaxID=1141098 RepID=A0A1Y2DW58_9PEZI|nr:uncharacterized protein BCR38DRAFT_229835 [Pseudomassariella vexata]ORY63521.1 hypothetical protein BCR38DRAFT_229835 [Pseudomassariella vexata]
MMDDFADFSTAGSSRTWQDNRETSRTKSYLQTVTNNPAESSAGPRTSRPDHIFFISATGYSYRTAMNIPATFHQQAPAGLSQTTRRSGGTNTTLPTVPISASNRE